jgi:hypothetical protein
LRIPHALVIRQHPPGVTTPQPPGSTSSRRLMRLGFARSGCGQPLDCSQGHSQPSMQNDGPGTSGQQAATTGQPWTVRPLLRIRWSAGR